MNILHTVEFYEPSMGGMQTVVKQLSENMASLGHTVTVATSKIPQRNFKILNRVKVIDFDISGNYVRGFKGETSKYLNFVLNSKFDVVTNFAAQQWATDLLLPHLQQIKAKKVFVPTGFSGLLNKNYIDYFKQMADWMNSYDTNVFLSNNYQDITYARKHKIRNITIIPNGASAAEFLSEKDNTFREEFGISDTSLLLLLVGSHTGQKGHLEAMKILNYINHSDVTLLIIGNGKSGCYLSCKGWSYINNMINSFTKCKKLIYIKYLDRKNTIKSLQAADLFIFPSTIECSPLVLFEACAAKTPFITTDVGNSREIINWTNGGVLMPTVKDKSGFSHANIYKSAVIINNLIKNRHNLKAIGNRGYQSWKNKFTWEIITRRYEKLYFRLLSL